MELLLAIETQSLDHVRDIINRKRIRVDQYSLGYRALIKAIEFGKKDIVKYLLDKKCKVNKSNKIDTAADTPLHVAVKLGDLSLVDRLLKRHASVMAVDTKGNSPLHLAFLYRKEAIIDRILLAIQKSSKYVNLRNDRGLTHMQIACTRKNVTVIKGFVKESMLTIFK